MKMERTRITQRSEVRKLGTKPLKIRHVVSKYNEILQDSILNSVPTK